MTAAYIPTYYIPQIPEDESNSRKRTFSFSIQWIYTADVFPLPDECFALGASTFFPTELPPGATKPTDFPILQQTHRKVGLQTSQ